MEALTKDFKRKGPALNFARNLAKNTNKKVMILSPGNKPLTIYFPKKG